MRFDLLHVVARAPKTVCGICCPSRGFSESGNRQKPVSEIPTFQELAQTMGLQSERWPYNFCVAKQKPAGRPNERVLPYCGNQNHRLGPNQLVAEAKSPHQAKEIASQLSQLGFKAIGDESDAYAGMLTLTYSS
jgi:hypothetical protein